MKARSENMRHILGDEHEPGNDLLAVIMAEYLDASGWELRMEDDGQYHAYRNGAEITPTQLRIALASALRI